MSKFYLQDTRDYVGNCILWWREGNAGYTTNIDEAAVVDESNLPRQRDTDRTWPKEYIDRHLRPTIDMQTVDHKEATAQQRQTQEK